ncbi:hypothetical protein ES695_10905 [Candidatus Atribacteria bacterium 1244-E10-H5-B2]|nr:MAG: hypothetical protein ES695_10905 [Candidatus Atribacteria bacterium 1244-E10-H5-B2]
MSEQEIADTISVGERSIYNWTITQRENAKKELEHKVIELYLRAWNTQKSIAKELLGDEKKQSSISDIMKNIENSIAGKIDKSWNLKNDDPGYSKEKPFLYNIWNLQKAEKETSHFGHFPWKIKKPSK